MLLIKIIRYPFSDLESVLANLQEVIKRQQDIARQQEEIDIQIKEINRKIKEITHQKDTDQKAEEDAEQLDEDQEDEDQEKEEIAEEQKRLWDDVVGEPLYFGDVPDYMLLKFLFKKFSKIGLDSTPLRGVGLYLLYVNFISQCM